MRNFILALETCSQISREVSKHPGICLFSMFDCFDMILCEYFIQLFRILTGIPGNQKMIDCPYSSCADRCGELSNQSYLCSCDNRCHMAGDCCWDVEELCFADVESVTAIRAPMATTRQCIHVSLVEESVDNDIPYSYVNGWFDMIVSCPEGADDDGGKCRDTESNLVHDVPVCHATSRLLFRNVWCAKCHGINPTELHPFQVWLQNCPIMSNFSAATGKFTDPDDMSPPQTACPSEAFYHIPGECQSTAQHRWCFYTYPMSNPSSQCYSHLNPVVSFTLSEYSPETYRNQFCAPEDHAEPFICYDPEKHRIGISSIMSPIQPSFTVLLMFDSNGPKVILNRFEGKLDDSLSMVLSDRISLVSSANLVMYIHPIFLAIYII